MYRIMKLMGLCGTVLAVAAGCAGDSQQVRPPKHPEEFRAPPETDLRYSKPIEYPRDTMGEDTILKKAKDAAKGNSGAGPMRPGMGNGPGARGF